MSLFSKLTGIHSSKSNKPIKNLVENEQEENFFKHGSTDDNDQTDKAISAEKSTGKTPKKKNLKNLSRRAPVSHSLVSPSSSRSGASRGGKADKLATKKITITEDQKEDSWEEASYNEEGELTIDVFQDSENNIIIKSTIAGVKPEDIDISINDDMLTIRGKRESEETIDEDNFYYKECYWGNFSRSIILPCDIKAHKITAKLKNGVLTVKLPKAKTEKKVAIKVVEE